jgi:GNAT superfamily N-acetyltransferase
LISEQPGAEGGEPLRIEPFAAEHAAGVVHVIGSAFAEHGMTFDPAGFDADLADVPGHYDARGGWFAVLTAGGRVVGTVAAVPHGAGAWEIKRLYLQPGYRGRGHGRALLEHALGRLRRAGAREAVAWSDARLETAHRVYAHLGFEPIGRRHLDDIDRSTELGFLKRLYPTD